MDEWHAPTFVTDYDLVRFAWYYGWVFPLSIIATFLFLYNRAQEQRLKQEREKQKELTNLKGRTNGVKKEIHE